MANFHLKRPERFADAEMMSSEPGKKRQTTGSGSPIEGFLDDASRLSAAEFEAQRGSAFLILTATGFKQANGASSTEVLLLGLDQEPAEERTEGVSVLVFPIRAAKSSLTQLVTVGRTSNNDLVIPDISVSRFHAFFKQPTDGGFRLHDAGSTNGTTVNGFSVCTKEAGEPSSLATGDNVRFGQIDMTFLEASALQTFVLKFGD